MYYVIELSNIFICDTNIITYKYKPEEIFLFPFVGRGKNDFGVSVF